MTDSNITELKILLEEVKLGSTGSLQALFNEYRSRLRRMVELRLDRRLQDRISSSEIIRDVYKEASHGLVDYLTKPRYPIFLWLRHLVGEKLRDLHKQYFGKSDHHGLRLFHSSLPAASTAVLAAQLLGQVTSPQDAIDRAENILRIQRALSELNPMEREILSMRHFENLTREEVAEALEIDMITASKYYIRALKELKQRLAELPGGAELV